MSDNIVEITETSQYTITIDTNLVQNDNGVTVETSAPNTIEIIDSNIILVSDLPYGYPLDWTTGNLPIARVSGLDIIGGSGISVSDNSGVYTIAVTGTLGLTGEEVDDRVSNLLIAGSYVNLNYNDNLDSLNISVTGLQPSGNYSLVGHSHAIADVSGLQNVLDSKQPSGIYASGIHTHVINDIVDFNSGVSGLLPVKNISSGSGISISNNSGDFTVSVTGNFGLTSEQVDDRVSNLLVASNYITLNYDDNLDILTIGTSGLQPSGNYSVEGHSHVIADVSGLQNALDSKQPSGSYAPSIHNHITSDITDFSSGVNALVSGVYAPLISPVFSGVPTVPTAPSGTNSTQIASTAFVRNEISNLVDSAPNTLDTLNELAAALGDDPNFATTIASGLAGKAPLVHSHASSDITNFNSSVSGLIPSVSGSGYVSSVFNNNIYTISVSGLQPSGNYANSSHTHSYTDITNFASGVDNTVSTLLIGGNYINLNYDSVYNTLTISASGVQPSGDYANSVHSHGNISSSGTIGSSSGLLITTTTNGALTTSSGISSSYITNFNSSVSGLLPSVSGIGYVNSNFANNIYSISVTGLQPSGNYSLVGHSHTSSNITDFNSSVSGLIPSITGSNYISTLFNNNTYTISATGLQPSGNYSVVGHTHTSTDITNFNSSVSGLIPVKDIVAGANIGVSSVSGVYTISTDNESSALVTTVFNKTGSPISKMSAVYIDGGQGDQPTVALAVATGDPTSAGTYGVTFEAIPNMSTGKVIVFGALTGVDTDIFNPTAPHGDVNGQVLYLSPTTPGGLTLTKPSAPNHIVAIGTIVRTHQNEGVIEVRVQNGFELDELHNVAISGVTSGQFLQYNGSGLWVPSSSGNFSTLLVNGTGVSLNGHTHTSSNITDFSSSVSGLLPVTNILGGSNVSVSSSGSIYTVAVTGSLGLTTEEVDDRVSNLLIAGSGISINYNDNANSLTISTIKNIILSDTVGSTNYIGKAIQGSSTGSNVWTINRTIYNSAGLVSSTGIATNVAWDNRISVSYT